jgi:hypothetical protein
MADEDNSDPNDPPQGDDPAGKPPNMLIAMLTIQEAAHVALLEMLIDSGALQANVVIARYGRLLTDLSATHYPRAVKAVILPILQGLERRHGPQTDPGSPGKPN